MGTVLVVDDLEENCLLIQAVLVIDGHVVRLARNGAEALQAIRAEPPDLVLMDLVMPRLDGVEACREIKRDPATRLLPVVLLTGLNDQESRLRGIEAGADDFIAKPFNASELRARVRSLLRIKRYTDELDHAESVIVSLALTVEARDPGTAGHCERLAQYASRLGRRIGLAESDIATLRRGGYLHDIGKIGIPDAVLLKPGPLDADEWATMKEHTVIGDELCGELRALRAVRPIVRHHHERLDGSGYPDGLRGDAIPLLAQIIGIADVFDAMLSERPYKPALPVARAADELRTQVLSGWCRGDLVDVFLDEIQSAGLVSGSSGSSRTLPQVFRTFLKANSDRSAPRRMTHRAS